AGPLHAALSDQLRGALHDPLPAGAPAPGSRLTRHAAMVALRWTEQSRMSVARAVRTTQALPVIFAGRYRMVYGHAERQKPADAPAMTGVLRLAAGWPARPAPASLRSARGR